MNIQGWLIAYWFLGGIQYLPNQRGGCCQINRVNEIALTDEQLGESPRSIEAVT